MRNDFEHQSQVALFRWAALNDSKHPGLSMMHAIPNGGLRNIRVAMKLKSEGVKSGVPDICLPFPMGNFHGLYIEMKSPKGRISPAQEWWLDSLTSVGYLAERCFDWVDAARIIANYLNLDLKACGIK